MIRAGRGGLLRKCSLQTDELMHAVTDRLTRLQTERRISPVYVMDVPGHAETLFIPDAAIKIFPDLSATCDIVQHAIDRFCVIGLGTPRVAILSAVESVTPKIPSAIEAAALCRKADRGQSTGGIPDGPLAFDNAINPQTAGIKVITSAMAGQARRLAVPEIKAGNMLAKNLIFLTQADAAGLVPGTRVPIVLTSRAEFALCAIDDRPGAGQGGFGRRQVGRTGKKRAMLRPGARQRPVPQAKGGRQGALCRAGFAKAGQNCLCCRDRALRRLRRDPGPRFGLRADRPVIWGAARLSPGPVTAFRRRASQLRGPQDHPVPDSDCGAAGGQKACCRARITITVSGRPRT